jgi:hypothetical protein
MERPDEEAALRFARDLHNDPIVLHFWEQYLQTRTDLDEPGSWEVAREEFLRVVMPDRLANADVLATEFLPGFLESWEQDRAKRAHAEMAMVATIERTWGAAFQGLDQVLSLLDDLLRLVRDRLRVQLPSVDWTRRALILLCARGIQTGWEIHTLLRSGFAAGAWARWRTLHEITVLATFIRDHGAAVAEAYLAHEHVQSLRTISAYEKSSATPETWRKARAANEPYVNELRDKFGKDLFKRDYGWAALAFPPNRFKYPRPSLADLESEAGLTYAAGACATANHVVHGGAQGFSDNPGHGTWPPTILLRKASPHGLFNPTVWTLHSLAVLARSFLLPGALPVESTTVVLVVRHKDQVMELLSEARERAGPDTIQTINEPEPPS